MTLASDKNPIVPGRRCDGCTLCCKLVAVEEIDKPMAEWCQHCDIGVGCKIYADRPRQCAGFYCGFLTNPDLGEEWRPSKCKIVLSQERADRLAVHVDPDRPNAWRDEPFFSALQAAALQSVPIHHQVVVYIGKRTIVILPDREVDLGIVADDEIIVTGERRTPSGMELDAFKMKKDDPRAVRFGLK